MYFSELDGLRKDNNDKDEEIKQLQDEKCQAEECVQKMEKDVNRKDRDLEVKQCPCYKNLIFE